MFNFLFKKELDTKSIVVIIFGIITAIFFPFLFLNKISLDGDTLMYTYPYFNFLKEHAGSLINIFSFGGYPVSAISHIGFFSPVYRLLVPFFDFISAYHLIIYADYLLAAFLTYSFIRSLGASKYASFLGMLAYIFSQWSVLWFSSINLSHIIYLLPALFLSILKLSENRWRYSLLLLSVVGLSLSYSHYQFLLLVLVFSGLFFLYIFYKKLELDQILVIRIFSWHYL